MFHVVTNANRRAFAAQLREMHEWRAKIFVGEQGWDLPLVDGLEIDAYDDEATIYFLDYDEDDRLVSGQRMRPTADKSLTGDLFRASILDDDGSLFAGNVWEMSRGFVVPQYRRGARQRRRAEMRLAILETGFAAGIDKFLAFTDVALLPYFLNSAYRFRILGLPLPTQSGDGIALEIEVSAAAIADMRGQLNLPEPTFLSAAPLGRGRVPATDFGHAMRTLLSPLRPAPATLVAETKTPAGVR